MRQFFKIRIKGTYYIVSIIFGDYWFYPCLSYSILSPVCFRQTQYILFQRLTRLFSCSKISSCVLIGFQDLCLHSCWAIYFCNGHVPYIITLHEYKWKTNLHVDKNFTSNRPNLRKSIDFMNNDSRNLSILNSYDFWFKNFESTGWQQSWGVVIK